MYVQHLAYMNYNRACINPHAVPVAESVATDGEGEGERP